jgi:hypothetical protein
MRRVAATGKEVRAAVGRMGSGQSAVRKGVSAKALVAAYLLPIGNRR